MLEKKEHQYEKAVLVGLITKDQDEEKLKEYMDELEFLAYTAGATVEKRFTQKMSQPDSKTFVGKDIIHIAIFDRSDKRTIYNMIYRDGKNGPSYIKRFNVSGVTRDKPYDLTNEKPGSQVLYFSCNPNGEAEVITILLRQVGSIKKLKFDIDFANLAIKGRTSKGNIVTKYPIKKIELKEKGISTLLPRKIWFDDTVQRLNVDDRGELLGEFRPNDKIPIGFVPGMKNRKKPKMFSEEHKRKLSISMANVRRKQKNEKLYYDEPKK